MLLLYCLVGIEILKQRRLFKSIGNDYATLDTIASGKDSSLNHSHTTSATVIEVSDQSRSAHTTQLNEGKEMESAPSTRFASHLRRSHKVTLSDGNQNRSPISFRQYILMPLMFFVVLLAIWVAPTANRVGAFINPHFVSYPLLLAVGSMGSLRGFWNGVVFLIIGVKARRRQKA